MYSHFKNAPQKKNDVQSKILTQMQPAVTLHAPSPSQSSPHTPFIFASPHSGRTYPRAWLSQCALKLSALRQPEDAYVDELFESAPDHGAPLLTANFPRSFVDVNRAEDELPPPWLKPEDIPSARAKAGLGVIPMAVGENRPIYKTPPSKEAGLARLVLYHAYHEALTQQIEATKARLGRAIVIDCHSMPGFGAMGARRADFILGDRFGKSCDPQLIKAVGDYLQNLGYDVTHNFPYAGGFVTAHYGKPERDVQVLQIEINRDLYLNPVSMRKKSGFTALQTHMSGLIESLTRERAASHSLAAQ